MKLYDLKYEIRKRRHHPEGEAETKLYRVINEDTGLSLWDIRHMEVFKNGSVAQFICKRQNLVFWIDNGTDSIPVFPKHIAVTCLAEEFIIQTPDAELAGWLKDHLHQKAVESIQQSLHKINHKPPE